MTKQILAESLKKLMLHHSFEKITIKDITDAAGFIRPTFYNHFKDKYDLVEWIFTEEIIRPGEQLFDVGLFREGIRLMLANMEKEKDFYVRAVKIQGQNSFREIVFHAFVTLIQKVFAKRTPFPETVPHFFRPEILAEYYANAETFLLMKWLESGMPISAEEVEKAHWSLITVSFEDVVKEVSGEEKENR
ncbi:TetR/AcrR family transcriptional regulator C-terminal domain-containing protein [Anaerotignum lactatifermentans]